MLKMTTAPNGEVTIYVDGKIAAEMIDLRSIDMGITPHRLISISELEAISIITHLEK